MGFSTSPSRSALTKKIRRRGKRGVANAAPLALGDSERGTGCVLSQVSNFSPNRNAVVLISFAQRALDLQYHHPQRHPDRGGCSVHDRNPPKKPKRSPRAGGAKNANDGKAPARHQDGTDQHPRCAPRPKPSRHRTGTGRTRDVGFIEGIGNCRG